MTFHADLLRLLNRVHVLAARAFPKGYEIVLEKNLPGDSPWTHAWLRSPGGSDLLYPQAVRRGGLRGLDEALVVLRYWLRNNLYTRKLGPKPPAQSGAPVVKALAASPRQLTAVTTPAEPSFSSPQAPRLAVLLPRPRSHARAVRG